MVRAGHAEPYYQQMGDETNIGPWYVRLSLENTSLLLEKRVTVTISNLAKEGTAVPGFVPVRLLWTHVNKPVLDFLAPKQTSFVDIGFIDRSNPIGELVFNVTHEAGSSVAATNLIGGSRYSFDYQVFGEDGQHAQGEIEFSLADDFVHGQDWRTPAASGFEITLTNTTPVSWWRFWAG